MMPCQWMAVSSGNWLVTRSVIVSPSRQRNVGAGSEPLTTVAMRGAPVKLTGREDTVRSNSVPVSTGAIPVTVAAASPAQIGLTHGDRPSRTPLEVSP